MEKLFTADDIYVVLATIVAGMLVITLWTRQTPNVNSVRLFSEMLNSRGGNILLLAGLTVYFFHHALKLFYVILQQVQAGTLKENNAVALMGIQFVTTTAFGGFSGSLLTMMQGDSRKGFRGTDLPPTVTNNLTASGN